MGCRVLLTGTSIAWLLMSTVSTLLILYSMSSPKWILGPQTNVYEGGVVVGTSWPSVGIISRCLRVEGKRSCALFILDGLSTDPQVFPTLWKAALVFLSAGLVIMSCTCIAAALAICVQTAFSKSIFTLTGTVQAAAGVLLMASVLLYAGGWGSARVIRLCGDDAQPYYLGDCTLGWGSYTALLSIVLTMLTAGLSVKAEKATNTEKVRRQMETGEVFVCLL